MQDAVAAQESVANDISDYYLERSGEKAVRQFCEVHNQIATTLFHEFVSTVALFCFGENVSENIYLQYIRRLTVKAFAMKGWEL